MTVAVGMSEVRRDGAPSTGGWPRSAPAVLALFARRLRRRRPHHLVAPPLLQAPPQQRLRAEAGQGGGARRRGARRVEALVPTDPAATRGSRSSATTTNWCRSRRRHWTRERSRTGLADAARLRGGERLRPGATPPGRRGDQLHLQRQHRRAGRWSARSRSTQIERAFDRGRAEQPKSRRRAARSSWRKAPQAGPQAPAPRPLLPAAVAMSGAAISPSMGKMTRAAAHAS